MGALPAALGIADWYSQNMILLAGGDPTVTFGITNTYFQVLILLVSIVMVAFFSSAEASLISTNKVRLRYLAEQGNRSAQVVNRVLSKPEKFFSTILLTENAFIIFASSFGTAMAITLLGGTEAAILIATAVMTVVIVAFGEITPKTLAARSADRWSLIIARPIALIMTLETPVIFFFTILPRVIVKFLGGQGHSFAPSVTEGELRMLINISRAEGTMDESEASLLEKVFHFGDRQVREVMTPRPEIVWIERGTTLKQFFGLYAEHSHTRFPVYEGAMENVVGILSNKDVMLALGGGTLKSDDSVTDLLRTAYFVPETKTVSSTFAEMQREGHGLALTVNEFGGIAGVATLNQLLGVIVGEVRDEPSDVEQEYTPVDEHTYNVMASIGVSEINEKLGLNIPEGHYETLAGFLLEQLGYIPVQGEVLQYENLTLTVKRSNGVRIEEVEVKKSTPFAD